MGGRVLRRGGLAFPCWKDMGGGWETRELVMLAIRCRGDTELFSSYIVFICNRDKEKDRDNERQQEQEQERGYTELSSLFNISQS